MKPKLEIGNVVRAPNDSVWTVLGSLTLDGVDLVILIPEAVMMSDVGTGQFWGIIALHDEVDLVAPNAVKWMVDNNMTIQGDEDASSET